MLKTAESVCAGHPDELCDYIADCIVERALYENPAARVAVEVLVTKGQIVVAGEIICKVKLKIPEIVRGSLAARGYDLRRFRIRVRVHRQIPDIAGGVDQSLEARQGQQDAYATIGAGDQGTVYGYATNETEERLPLPLVYAQRICQRLDEAFYQFLLAAFTNMVAASEAGALAYVFHADTEGLNFRKAFKEAGLYLSGTCIWVKDSLVLGRSPYQW